MVLVSPPLASADNEIRVLIQDKEKGFGDVPKADEKLKKIDDIDGRLVLGYNSYEGRLSIWKGKGEMYLVNALDLEDYVKGVVLAEVGRQWAPEALKAQAVLVRTYVLNKMFSATRDEFHVVSSVLDQVYKGLSSDPEVEAAVNSTRGEILTYKGKPIQAFYHSTSVGRTELPESVFSNPLPYLKSVEASGRLSPHAFWNKRVQFGSFESKLNLKKIREIWVGSRTSTDRADEVVFVSGEGERVFKAKDLRSIIGWGVLKSTDFNVHVEGSEAVFVGKGSGHGVGLCQWTSLEMALEGKNYKDILFHFYKGVEITLDEDL